MGIRSSLVVSSMLTLIVPAAVAAQSSVPTHRCTTAGLSGGVASASSDVGVVFGGGVGAALVPNLSIEGRMAWLSRDDGGRGLSVNLSAQVGWPRDRAVAPFVRGGIGLYRATFDTTRAPLPDYYAARSTGPGTVGTISFADPAIVAGGGASLYVTHQFAIRPEVETLVVTRGPGRYIVTSVAVWAVFHFEQHRITPARGPR